MTDLSSGRPRARLLERLSTILLKAPDDWARLLRRLRAAYERDALDADALSMIEGVLQVADLTAADIMVPRAQIDAIDLAQAPAEFLPFLIDAAHSRFPVYEGSRDHVVGILHAKDLLRLIGDPDLDWRSLLRAPTLIPETKRLNVLLREFRINRGHLALVVDEHGGVSGLVTIEDVLEQIVGEIEDEFDEIAPPRDIVALEPGARGRRRLRVSALADVAALDAHCGTSLASDDYDTVGGLIAARMGRVPRRGERLELQGWRFEVVRATSRAVRSLRLEQLPPAAGDG
jgi:magnesium and cobalt transporter